MSKAQGPRPRYRQRCRLLSSCFRNLSCALHNRRPVNILFPEFDKRFLTVVNGRAWLPEVTRYHRLVKRKLGAVLRCYQHTIAASQCIAELDKAIWPLASNVHNSERGEVQALENRNIHEGMVAFVGPDFDAGQSGFLNNDSTAANLGCAGFRSRTKKALGRASLHSRAARRCATSAGATAPARVA